MIKQLFYILCILFFFTRCNQTDCVLTLKTDNPDIKTVLVFQNGLTDSIKLINGVGKYVVKEVTAEPVRVWFYGGKSVLPGIVFIEPTDLTVIHKESKCSIFNHYLEVSENGKRHNKYSQLVNDLKNENQTDFTVQQRYLAKQLLKVLPTIDDYQIAKTLCSGAINVFHIPVLEKELYQSIKKEALKLNVEAESIKRLDDLINQTDVRKIGQLALPFTFTDRNGNKYDFPKDFVGKRLLIDFWHSGCKPCRIEMKELAKQINEHESFEILSISLDSEEQPWLSAIAKDKTESFYHVLNANIQEDPNKYYHIQAIPDNILIDTNGRIIGNAIRAANLKQYLDKK